MTAGDSRSTSRWQRLRRQILERDGYACQVPIPHDCGGHLTLGHIIPHADGGEDTPDNLRCECSKWNYREGQRIGQRRLRQKNRPSRRW